MNVDPIVPACRETIPQDQPIRWMAPDDARDRKELSAWCLAVGPVVRYDPQVAAAADDRPLVIVSWNMAVGAGNLANLVNDVRTAESDGEAPVHLILLIQEAYRVGDVPARCPPHSGVAKRLGPRREPASDDIIQLARRLGMYAAYAPSMRNGTDCSESPYEDRGNAILSTLPLTDVVAIELPFAQQRRVAVAATVKDRTRALGVMSVHFDTVSGHGRQAQALWKTVEELQWQERTVIGGDFNSWPFDSGLREMRKHFVESDCGTGGTHTTGRRLDRLFTRGLPSPACRTGSARFGSDHRPLVARLAD
jgi:endonuclease/exonuclease/phosphatase family metal-dependent hydrolase